MSRSGRLEPKCLPAITTSDAWSSLPYQTAPVTRCNFALICTIWLTIVARYSFMWFFLIFYIVHYGKSEEQECEEDDQGRLNYMEKDIDR